MNTQSNYINIPLSLYIHTPWCIKKCPYCDFNSYKLNATLPEQEYIAALIADFANDICYVQGREIQTIFFGGGTPSLFSADAIYTLLHNLQGLVKFADDIEITLEANPATIEQKFLTAYKQAGITRISLGAQSFQNDKLKVLERIHTAKEILTAVEKVKQAKFKTFNIDLMYGLPAQTVDDAIYDLQTAIDCKPTHISWYELTLEPGTAFYNNNISLPAEDLRMHMQKQGIQLLADNGFERYEISAYAKPQHQCKHNLNYWQFGDYIGIGAGAHSKTTDLIANKIARRCKQKTPKEYLACNSISTPAPELTLGLGQGGELRFSSVANHGEKLAKFIVEEKILTAEELPFEFMLNALRLTQGFATNLFTTRTYLPTSNINAILKQAEQKGLLTLTAEKIIPTQLGALFLNDLVQLFM